MIAALTGMGLSAAAGLNAYIPYLIVALIARFTDLITLPTSFAWIESWWAIGIGSILLIAELVLDKIPAIDTVNDTIQTFIRPAAGAILFAGSANVITDIHPILSLGAGLLVAGGVHATKAAARPVVTVTTAGVGNPVVSTLEDIVAVVVSLLAVVLPIIAAVILLVFLIFIITIIRRWRRRKIMI